MVAAGWQELSSGSDANGPSYELLSCQVPWFDPDNTPAWYEQQIYVQFRNTAANNITVITGAWDGAASYMRSDSGFTPFRIRFSGVTSDWFVHASPYQIVVWHATTPGPIAFTVDSRSFIASALNLPKFIQEQGVANMLLSTNGLTRTSVQELVSAADAETWSAHSLFNGTQTFYLGSPVNDKAVQFLGVTTINRENNYSASALWQQALDSVGQNPAVWQPMILPPYLIYPRESASAIVSINGFLWDMLMTTRWATYLAEMLIDTESRWLNLVGSTIIPTQGAQAGLFILMDEIGV
jgi:hypothetical protein